MEECKCTSCHWYSIQLYPHATVAMVVSYSDAQSSSNNTIAQDVLYCSVSVNIPIKNLHK